MTNTNRDNIKLVKKLLLKYRLIQVQELVKQTSDLTIINKYKSEIKSLEKKLNNLNVC